MLKYTLFVWIVICGVLSGNAQKTVKAEITHSYYAPENITLEQAKQKAVEYAQIKAIANEFGTLIQQMNSTAVKNINENSDVTFNSLTSSDVRGEWIRTIGEPEFDIYYDNRQLVVTVRIKGEIRELAYLKPKFLSKLLRNGTKDNFESEEFRDGDNLYFAFTSPTKGYLSLFTKDDSIRCLLPYVDEPSGMLSIKANQRYLFFTEYGERLQMYCSGATEINTIYVLFSPNPIVRPLSEHVDDGGMAVFSDEEYKKWLAKVRSHDKELQMEIKYITIKK